MNTLATPIAAESADRLKMGIVCTGADGRVLHAVGIGREPAILARVRDPQWVRSVKESRLASLKFNGRKLVLLWCDLAEGGLLAVREASGDTVFEFIAAVDFAYDIFDHLLSNPFDGMTVVDAKGIVRFISPIHEKFFNHQHGEASGKPVQMVIENTRLHKIVQTGKSEVGFTQRMGGTNRVVSRTPIFRNDEIVGAIGRVMFKGPEQLEELNQRINSLQNEVEFYKREADAMRRQDFGISNIIGTSTRIEELKKDIIRVAPLDVPVLIIGESGSGKELVAQALHRLSSRRTRSMIMINAAALPSTLVESELFGYSAGAFTGAHQKGHAGKFEQANGSSLFLDEIGDMPLEVQAKLLRVLQDGSVEKLGGSKPIKADFRLISATNRDIDAMVGRNEFRLDLYYRISPVVLRVPPLRDRREDIPLLAEEFLQNFAERHGRPRCHLGSEAVEYMQSQGWPGNVRQLKHELERAAIFNSGGTIDRATLQRSLEGMEPSPQAAAIPALTVGAGSDGFALKDRLQKVEDDLIQATMTRCRGNKKKVAEELGISRSYLYKKLAEIGGYD
jgi:transcriptional regulator with PAS, ATPase and Fis domain